MKGQQDKYQTKHDVISKYSLQDADTIQLFPTWIKKK